ncbi:MAG: hypothetical protein P9M02_05650 [Candidatus Susulua stagnicola]|nr:hypothetical protein [Candidatus Susulua stagnicola]
MKNRSKRIICCILAFQIFYFNPHSIAYTASKSSKKIKPPKVRLRNALSAEEKFYKGDFEGAALFFETLDRKKNRNCALFNNQLGSIYMAKGDCEKALDSFLKAYYLMNDISAFENLESGAVSLFGSEARKAYKGDPYEKVFNSLYVGLLLANKGDFDNASAAFKNGILCDSDVKDELYGSDVSALYLFAARLALKQNNSSLSKDYFNKATKSYRLASPLNRSIVSQEQALVTLLYEKQKELKKLEKFGRRFKRKKKKGTTMSGTDKASGEKSKTTLTYNKKTLGKIKVLSEEIEELDENIKELSSQREVNSRNINTSILKSFTDLKNNTFLCLELGRGPLKYQTGHYGQLAVFTVKPHKISEIKVFLDDKEFSKNLLLLDNDIFFQARTRGGREMDNILKGQAQFKQTTAETSLAFYQASQNIQKQANQMSSANPYYDASGQYAAAGILALVSLAIAITSAAANPVADVKHWSLLPGNIIILPFSMKIGTHNIKIDCYSKKGNLLNSSKFSVEIEEKKDNIFFKRFF